ncbi:MAG: polysaccharide biosynthesis tyrosine autokinase [Paracoccaceae bacterium]
METLSSTPVKEIDLRTIGALLRRQYQIIVASAVAVFSIAIIFLVVAAPTYTATALILVDPDSQNVLSVGTTFPSTAGRDNARVDSEVEILKSDAIALAVIASEKLATDTEFGSQPSLRDKLASSFGLASASPPDARHVTAKTLERLKQNTTIRRRGLTYLVTVSTISRSPDKAADIANKLSQAYIDQQVQAKIFRSLAARDVLNRQIIAARMSLTSYEAAFDQFLDANRDRLSNETGSNALTLLQFKLEQAENEKIQIIQNQQTARRLLQQQNWSALIDTLPGTDLVHLATKRAILLDRFPSETTQLTSADFQSELAELDAKLMAHSTAGLQNLSAQGQDIDQNIASLRSQLHRTVLSRDLSPDILTDIYSIQQETSIARAQYDNLLSRMRDLDTQANIQIADSRIVSPAIAPISATFPNRSLVLLAALAAASGLGISLAFMKEYYIGGIYSSDQLSDLLLTPSLASIPITSEPKADSISAANLVFDAPLSAFSESVRNLRAVVDQAIKTNTRESSANSLTSGRIILVTSTLANEGKTTTALSLARTYAQAGHKALLIDADLRKPSLHRHLGIEPKTGFLDYLVDASTTKLTGSFYARDTMSDLVLIMGAEPSAFPTDQLINSVTFKALLTQAKQVYDVVIIDSPPLLPVVDARYIAQQADATVLVVKWAETGQIDLKFGVQKLRDAMQDQAVLVPVLTQVSLGTKIPAYGSYSAAI